MMFGEVVFRVDMKFIDQKKTLQLAKAMISAGCNLY